MGAIPLGDMVEDQTFNFRFFSGTLEGVGATLSGTPALAILKDNGTTPITDGITLSVDSGSVTGRNLVTVDLSASASYAPGSDYSIVVTAGTVNGKSVVGHVVAEFSIENRSTAIDAAGIRSAIGLATANLDTQLADLPTVAEFNARTLVASAYFDPAADTVASVTSVGTVTGNVNGSVANVTGGINTAAGTITTLDGLGTSQDAQHGTTQADIAIAQADLDLLTGTDGATLATLQPNYAPNTTTPPTAAAIRAEIDSNSTQLTSIKSDTTTLLARITSTLFSGITSLAQWLGALAGKQAPDATAQTEIRSTGAGGTYDATTDSMESLRDRGDAAWVTGTSGTTESTTTDTELSADDIAAAALGPKRVTGDEGTVEERDIGELIEADRYQRAKEAADAPGYGVRASKIRFPDTQE